MPPVAKSPDIESEEKMEILKICKKHNGKMKDLQSLSTSIFHNCHCMRRINNERMICSKCYANAMEKCYTNLSKALEYNTEILTKQIISFDLLPYVNPISNCFRFESFGDLINDKQVINYFNICEKNQSVNFALWTKNPWIIEKAMKGGYKKPDNLQIVVSSCFINKENKTFMEKYKFIDKVFTVYDKNYIKENNIEINCGAASCATCQKCYHDNGIKTINEKLK